MRRSSQVRRHLLIILHLNTLQSPTTRSLSAHLSYSSVGGRLSLAITPSLSLSLLKKTHTPCCAGATCDIFQCTLSCLMRLSLLFLPIPLFGPTDYGGHSYIDRLWLVVSFARSP